MSRIFQICTDLLVKKIFLDPNRFFRRSIFSIQNIKKGEKFTNKNIKTLRPCIGLSASNYENILGKKSLKNIKAGKPLSLDCVRL